MIFRGESDLASVARALARRGATRPSDGRLRALTEAIRSGADPLGAALCTLRTPEQRRPMGAVYTPASIVSAMLRWARAQGMPDRVVDAGSGSGAFLLAAGRAFPEARLTAVELDPLAALLCRANLAAAGLASRSEVIAGDYREAKLGDFDGRTLFIGNPPYVRHHLLGRRWKTWLTRTAARRGLPASQLAGLHVHFFLATLEHARPGDFGAFVTAAEWLDVNYGQLLRRLFLGELGGLALHVLEPAANPFPGTATTAAIACFRIGARPAAIRLRRVASAGRLGALEGGPLLRREHLEAAPRWTPLTRTRRRVPSGFCELGELCRVHRGQATGANGFWIAGDHAVGLPATLLYPSVTKARELYTAGRCLADSEGLRKVIDLPEDLDVLDSSARRAVEALLRKARRAGIHRGYLARHRKAWWSIGLREPAPILATYMARRPPSFVRNAVRARHINIAHGLYPRAPMSGAALDALAGYLSGNTSLADGRTYAGGLTKFEPREMERLLIPAP